VACLGAEYMEEGITSRWCLRRSAPNHTGNVERQVNMESTPHMVVVATVSQPFEATPIQMKLGSFGIESELNGEMTVAANPFLSNAIGGIQVLVSETDAERATEILAEHRRVEAEVEAVRARTCPKCGNTNGVPVKRPVLIAILAVVTLGAFCLLYPWPRYRCQDCRHKWK
jgi:hypothetical protein